MAGFNLPLLQEKTLEAKPKVLTKVEPNEVGVLDVNKNAGKV